MAEVKRDKRVEVVVPHRSRWDLLARLIGTLDSQTLVPSICVVDNASEDETRQELSARTDIRLCEFSENVGFGRAINHGVRTSAAEIVIFLNNDMVADTNFIEALVNRIDSGVDVVAAKQLAPNGSIDSLGVSVDRGLGAYDVGHGKAAEDAIRLSAESIGPSGGAAAFLRNRFLSIGGYDEAIFAYLEDVDLALRLVANGMQMTYCDDAVVTHLHSSTLGSGSAAKNELLGWSRGYLLWKYRRSLSAAMQARGCFVDSVVYLAQLAIDRNAGSIRGRRRFRAERHQYGQLDPIDIPDNGLSIIAGLRRRMGRR